MVQLSADDVPFAGRTIRIDGRDFLNFVTCSYLGLELDPRVIQAIADGAVRFGASFSISRAFVSAAPYAALEQRFEKIFDAFPVVAPTTTLGHFSFVTALIETGDVLLLDAQVHNSVQLAARVVADRATVATLRHNDLRHLERTIERYLAMPSTRRVWYFGDGIYSMHGDTAPVAELLDLLNRHERFHCYLDDAHGMSVHGTHGRGFVLAQSERLHPRMVVAVSLAKGFGLGCGGVLVFPNADWQSRVRSCGATLLFSGPIAPPLLTGAIASADIHLSDEFPRLQAELRERIDTFREAAQAADLHNLSSPDSPVQYLLLGRQEKAVRASKRLRDAGFLVNPCTYPAVAKNHAGLRLTMTRHVTLDDVRAVVDAITRTLES
jgi:7-keto-8-aminopelargonate synthetase-like enzyme